MASARQIRPLQGTFGTAAQPSFGKAAGLAVDASSGDLLIVDGGGNERQELTVEAAENLGGFYRLSFQGQSTGWTGAATLSDGSLSVTGFTTATGKLIEREQISGTGIQPGTIVTSVDEAAGTFTLSEPASISGTSSDLQAELPAGAASFTIQEALEKLSTVGTGNVGVTGFGSDPRIIEFRGAFARTEVSSLACDPGGLSGNGATCSLATVSQAFHPAISRFKPNGEADPFSALGTNYIALPIDSGINGGDNVAVDNSGTATDGNIYVGTDSPVGVRIFAADGHFLGQLTAAGPNGFKTKSASAVAVDPAGSLYVADYLGDQIYKFTATANPPTNADGALAFPFAHGNSLAFGVGPSLGSLFAVSFGPIFKLDPTNGAVLAVVDPNSSSNGSKATLAVNPANGHVFVALGSGSAGIPFEVHEYDASGQSPVLVSNTSISGLDFGDAIAGIASSGPGDLLYLTTFDSHVDVYGPPVPVPDVATSSAALTGLDSATLNGTVNPDGGAITDCHFAYLTDAAYQANPPKTRFAGAATVQCTETLASIGAGHSPVPVHADLTGLATPGIVYHFRLVAASANGSVPGAERTLTTPDEPTITDSWTARVTSTEAIFEAEINPQNALTTYHLDYGFDATYGNATPEEPVGAGDSDLKITSTLTALQPDSTYHVRFVATNPLGTDEGPDLVFHTFPEPAPDVDCPNDAFRTGAGAYLPDCRAFELVSPLDKNNGDIASELEFGPADEAQPDFQMASPDGQRATFSAYTAFADPEAAPFHSQYLASRDPATGWQVHSISPPRGTIPYFPGLSPANSTQFQAFSEDLCSSWFIQDTDLTLTPDAPAGGPNIYRRDDGGCGGQGYGLITTARPPEYAGGEGPANSSYFATVQGSSADSRFTLLRAPGALTPDACTTVPGTNSAKGIYQLYLHNASGQGGELRLVSVLPSGNAACVHSSGGSAQGSSGSIRRDSVYHALSADASRVYWSAYANSKQSPSELGGAGGLGPLYLRLNPTGPQSSSPDCNGALPGEACTLKISAEPTTRFWGADADGSTAIYSAAGGLYRFELATATSTAIVDSGFQGVMGISDDANSVYFASSQVLTDAQQNSEGATAQAGKPNLYLDRKDAQPLFVATLSSSDISNGGSVADTPSPLAPLPNRRLSRVSLDGRHAAFTSFASLTGYDNTDAASGEADAEVFLYDAPAGTASGELACISCNPSGARPQARKSGRWHAARVPGWEYQLHASRALSENGDLLFFESYDPLLPRDVNDRRDVYQWQRSSGTEQCAQAGAELYVQSAGGCLSLISSGQGSQDSDFFDASADGSDVFFATSDSLLPSDPDLTDVYDARRLGGFPESPPTPLPCEGDECQRNPVSPPVGPGPGTSVFLGPADPKPTFEKRCPKGKRKVRRKGKVRCLPRRRGHQRAANHNRRSR